MAPLKPVLAQNANFRGYLSPRSYTLCLGAGVSRGIAPDWSDLARELLSDAFSAAIPKSVFDDLLKLGWSLDALIQAAANQFDRAGRPKQEFSDALEHCLYSKVRDKARGMGLDRHLIAVLNRPKTVAREKVIEVCDFLENSFPDCSLFQVGRFLLAAGVSGHGPKAVLSFNADTFLETYLALFARRQHYLGPPPHGHPPYYYFAVSDSGGGSSDKIPIYHCHGSIAPLERAGRRPRDRRDQLVFLEQEYLALASGHSAWAQTVFLFHAQTTRMAFCGLSMSDTNIRRWMNAMEKDARAYYTAMGDTSRSNPEHIWIRPQPPDALSQEIVLVSMVHLGVRPAWLSSWPELEAGLGNLAAVPGPAGGP